VTNDVREWGGWAQLGYDFTHQLSLWAVGGMSRPNESDVQAAGGGRSESSVIGGMLRFKQGWFAFGPEFYHVIAKIIDKAGNGVASGSGAPDGVINVNQLMLSGTFFF
jgi:hypothetical protein